MNNDDFWNLGNSTTELPDGVVEDTQEFSDDTEPEPLLPMKSDVPLTQEVHQQVSGFQDLEMVLSDLPQDVVDNMPTIQNRINAYLTYFSAMNLARLPKLMQFIQAAEDLMFNPKDLAHLDFDQITEIYKCAKFSSNEILESARKVSQTVQQEKDRKVDSLYNMLTSLSPDTISKLISMVEEEQSGDHNEKQS